MPGISFGEMVLIGVVAIVVVGPRNLPALLRNVGGLIGRVRRMAMEIRNESGIDDILKHEGIQSEIENFRKLASGEIDPDAPPVNVLVDREREYPHGGCDNYGALDEDVAPYVAPALPPAGSVAASAPALPESSSGASAAAATAPTVVAPMEAIPTAPKVSVPPRPSTNGAGVKS